MSRYQCSTGTAFENSLTRTCEAYESAGIATLVKVDPPTKVIRRGKASPTVVFLRNPFLDFTGVWTANGGKALHIETKYTSVPILKIGENGIKTAQLQNAFRWQQAGAAVAFLWRFESETRLVTPAMVRAQLTERKSLRWCDAHRIPQGRGFILVDFLAVLSQIHKPRPSGTTPQTP